MIHDGHATDVQLDDVALQLGLKSSRMVRDW